jgi:hypothetical protein
LKTANLSVNKFYQGMAVMRTIEVSTDVFAAIWANRQAGEDDENAILARLLAAASGTSTTPVDGYIGHRDARSGTEFPPGFEIARVYRGREYRAQAVGGIWIRTDNQTGYLSLNQLSRSIGITSENAWKNWYFTDVSGKRSILDNFRKASQE